MTVQVYKPVQRSYKPVQGRLRQTARSARVDQTSTDAPPVRKVRHSYRPIQPCFDLVLAIEVLTHPNSPTFDELEAVIFEELSTAE